MHRLSAVVSFCALFTACGGSSEFTTGGSVAIEELPTELGRALCQAQEDCAPFFYSIAFANLDCTALLSQRLEEASLSQIQAAVAAKTVTYDATLARSCVSAVSTGACGVLDNQLPDACRQALTGTVASGGACDIDAQCAGSSRCQVDGNTCPGTCAPLASAGVACEKDGDCAFGLICSKATTHCTKPAALGESCQGGSATQCAAGLLCIGNDDEQMSAGKCSTTAATLIKKEGERCDLQQGPWCTTGLSCVVESYSLQEQTLSASCHPIAAAGGECGLGIPGDCPAGQYCPLDFADILLGRVTAQCNALPGEGEACAPALALSRCAGALVCDTTTTPLQPVCVSARSLGQACSGDELCHSQHCVNQVCVPESACAK